tara:strand:+ start:304 stop:576 length:273 start_codon:yes stop_codon:yes gene_type:complete
MEGNNMIRMTDILNDEIEQILAHCEDVCDSDSFDDVRLVGSPDLHDSHVLAWHGDLLTDMDDDELNEMDHAMHSERMANLPENTQLWWQF